MAPRTPARGRASTRSGGRSRGSSSSSSSSQAPILVGVAVVAVVILVLVLNSGGSSEAGSSGTSISTGKTATTPSKPSPQPLGSGSARPGKTPTVAAPAIGGEKLAELQSLLGKAQALRNESVQARVKEGDNQTARSKMAEAKVLLDQWHASVVDLLEWQDQAMMEGWAQPAEFSQFEKLYQKYSTLENEVRRGGG